MTCNPLFPEERGHATGADDACDGTGFCRLKQCVRGVHDFFCKFGAWLTGLDAPLLRDCRNQFSGCDFEGGSIAWHVRPNV